MRKQIKYFICAVIGYLAGFALLTGIAIYTEAPDTLREGILITPLSEDYSNDKTTLNENFEALENEQNETSEDIDHQLVKDYLGIPDEIDNNGYLWRYFTDDDESTFIAVSFNDDESVERLNISEPINE